MEPFRKYIVKNFSIYRRVLPCVIDIGTNNQKMLADPRYLGLKQPRYSIVPASDSGIHGCFTHLRIVHHTDGPARMNHLTNCPL